MQGENADRLRDGASGLEYELFEFGEGQSPSDGGGICSAFYEGYMDNFFDPSAWRQLS